MRVITRLRFHRRLSTILTGLAAATAAVSTFAAPASAATNHHAFWPHPGGTTAAGYVYVNDDTAGANTIAGFERDADGSLTPLTGSPFAAPGPLDAEVRPTDVRCTSNEGGGHPVGAFAVQGRDLTELQSSPVALPAGATAAGVSVVTSRGWR
jgi:hypothetical protein